MISTQITHASTPTETQFNFSMATKIGRLDEESINRCYQLVSSIMVALCTQQASAIHNNRPELMRHKRLRLDEVAFKGVRQDFDENKLPTLELV